MRTQTVVLFALVLTLKPGNGGAQHQNEKSTKPMPRFIRKLFRQLFVKDLKEKRGIKDEQEKERKEDTKSIKKQVVNAIHVGPHLGSPQGTIGTGYYGNVGFPMPAPAILPTGHRSDIEDHKHVKKTSKKKSEKKWLPYGTGYPAPDHLKHGFGYSGLSPGYNFPWNTYPGGVIVRCEVPKGKDQSSKRCFLIGGYGLGYPGGVGCPGCIGFPGYSLFPGFIDRPAYCPNPWQKSAKKSVGHPGCRSSQWRFPVGTQSFYGSPAFKLGLANSASIPAYFYGSGYRYPVFRQPYALYNSMVEKNNKHSKRFLHGLQFPYGAYPGFGCSAALTGGCLVSGNLGGIAGPIYPGGYPYSLGPYGAGLIYKSKLPKTSSEKKAERKQVIGYNPGIYAGLTGVFYPASSPSTFSYGFPLQPGIPVYGGLGLYEGLSPYGGFSPYGGLGPFGGLGFYRSVIARKEGKVRDGIVKPRQIIGPAIGASLHGDGQGLGMGYPGATNLIQPGIAGVGDYGLGGGYGGVPLGLGNTGFMGYGMGGIHGFTGGLDAGVDGFVGLGPGLSTAFGGDLHEGGFGSPDRSIVPENEAKSDKEGDVKNHEIEIENSSEEDGKGKDQDETNDSKDEEYRTDKKANHAKRQTVPQVIANAPPEASPFAQAAAQLPSYPEVVQPAAYPPAIQLFHPFAQYPVPPTRNIHVGSPHVKVDVQTTRRSVEESPEDLTTKETSSENKRIKRQVSPVFTPVAAEPAAVPPVRYPVPPADAYPFGAGIAWPSAAVPSGPGNNPFLWSRSTMPGLGMLVPRGIIGGMEGLGGMESGMGGGMGAGMGGGMMGLGGGMGGGLGAMLGGGGLGGAGGGLGGPGLGMLGGIGGGIGAGGLGGGLGALLGGGRNMEMPGGMGGPQGGLGAALGGGGPMLDQGGLAGFSGGSNDPALTAALPGATSMPGASGVQKKSGVPEKTSKRKKITKSKKH